MRKDLKPEERVIVAVDVSQVEEAIRLVAPLKDFGVSFKFGLEFIYSTLNNLLTLDEVKAAGCLRQTRELFALLSGQAFLDTKGMDIPNTMKKAALNIAPLNVRFFNLYCLGGREMMGEVVAARNAVRENGTIGADQAQILGVTILTSLSYADLVEMGLRESISDDAAEVKSLGQKQINEIAVKLAILGKAAGLDGFIASAKEAKAIREACGDDSLIVTPGIRPEWAAVNDQKRPVTPTDAVKELGADLLVIGRPITKPPAEIGGPVDALKRILDEIAAAV